jgi:two-component sensor histidine kinase
MEMDPEHPDGASGGDAASAAALRHQFRNRIQTMTSLVGLFGRRQPPGPCRQAFEDLRARFEALAFGHDSDGFLADRSDNVSLAELTRRVALFLDPAGAHRLAVTGGEMQVFQRRGAAIAQIVTEMIIDLYRNGFDEAASCAGEIAFDLRPDGALTIRVAQTEPADAPVRGSPADLGLTIARSMIASLRGELTRSPAGPLALEAVIPAEASGS